MTTINALVETELQKQMILDLNLLRVDDIYQRELKSTNVKKIAKEFSPLKCGELRVSKREDGFYYIMDGQHRFEAMKLRGIPYAMCMVYESLSLEQEALLFDTFNFGAKPTYYEKNKAKIVYKDETVTSILKIVEESSLSLSFTRKDFNGIKAHKALEQVYKVGEEHFREVLSIIVDCYNKDKDSLQGQFIIGLSRFLQKYGQQIVKSELIKKLKKEGIVSLMVSARGIKSTRNGATLSEGVTETIKHFYNKGRREDNKID